MRGSEVLHGMRGWPLKKEEGGQPGRPPARGTPTMKLWSFDARSKGQPGYSRAVEGDDL